MWPWECFKLRENHSANIRITPKTCINLVDYAIIGRTRGHIVYAERRKEMCEESEKVK